MATSLCKTLFGQHASEHVVAQIRLTGPKHPAPISKGCSHMNPG